jgi:putative ABC transport system ATP-binding protein
MLSYDCPYQAVDDGCLQAGVIYGGETMLEISSVRKRYNGQLVLDGVSLSVGEREMTSIMGKSGSGKSTLLAVTAGLVRPDDGSVSFNGFDIGGADEESLAGFRLRNVGFIFQDFKLIPSLTVYDNIHLGIYPRKDVGKDEKRRRIEALAGEVGLGDKLGQRANDLSGGEKQRVAIARSLVNRPAVVLADEPTGNLDSKTADDIMALFTRLHGQYSTSFVIVTHDKDIAARTEKTYFLKDGGLTPWKG